MGIIIHTFIYAIVFLLLNYERNRVTKTTTVYKAADYCLLIVMVQTNFSTFFSEFIWHINCKPPSVAPHLAVTFTWHQSLKSLLLCCFARIKANGIPTVHGDVHKIGLSTFTRQILKHMKIKYKINSQLWSSDDTNYIVL